MSGRLALAACVLALAAAACEPSGPGALIATVQAPMPTGAAVVEVAGHGIGGFSGLGDVRTFAGTPAVGDSLRRVVLVSPSGGTLRFSIQVEDVGAEPPRATVLSAADPSNRMISALTGYTVRISR